MIFVFGSNLAGRHGRGDALLAYTRYGAKYFQASGIQGNSYAIPIRDKKNKPLPVYEIKKHVDEFIAFAKANPSDDFLVRNLCSSISGGVHMVKEIAPLFRDAPRNCHLPDWWRGIAAESFRKSPT